VNELNAKLEKIQTNIEVIKIKFNSEENDKNKEFKSKIEVLSSDKESLLKINEILK
jgi:hypothetical protein